MAHKQKGLNYKFKNNGNIKWNFTKFLIDRNGEIIARFEPTAAMKDVKAKVEEVLYCSTMTTKQKTPALSLSALIWKAM